MSFFEELFYFVKIPTEPVQTTLDFLTVGGGHKKEKARPWL